MATSSDHLATPSSHMTSKMTRLETPNGHLGTLSSRLPSNAVSMETGHLGTNSTQLSRDVSSPSVIFSEQARSFSLRGHRNERVLDKSESNGDNVVRLLAKTLRQESGFIRSLERKDKRRRNFKAKYLSPDKAVAVRDLDVESDTNERDKTSEQTHGDSRNSRTLSPAEVLEKKNFGSASDSLRMEQAIHQGHGKPTRILRASAHNQSRDTETLSNNELEDFMFRDKHSFNKPSHVLDRKPNGMNSQTGMYEL